MSRAVHDPLATAETCAGCKLQPGSYDHEAVRRARPRDFEAQVERHVREGLTNGQIAGYKLQEGSQRKARRFLAEIERKRAAR